MPVHIRGFFKSQHVHGGINRSDQLSQHSSLCGLQSIYPARPNQILDLVIRHPMLLIRNIPKLYALFSYKLNFWGYIAVYLYVLWVDYILRTHKFKAQQVPWIEISPEVGLCIGISFVIHKLPYICYPHNIEFLVPGQPLRIFRNQAELFSAELSVYSNAHAVNCISLFDKSILQALNIKDVKIYNYSPPQKKLDELVLIKNQRKHTPKTFYFILGSATNPPSMCGMKSLIESIIVSSVNLHFIVAGNGTDCFKYLNAPRILVLGRVSEEQLNSLLTLCIAVVINPVASSGILTRVIDNTAAEIHTFIMGEYIQHHELASDYTTHFSSMIDFLSPHSK